MWLRSKAGGGKAARGPDGPPTPCRKWLSPVSSEHKGRGPGGQGRRTLFRFWLSLAPCSLPPSHAHSSTDRPARPGWTYQVFVWITAALAGLRAGRRKFRNGVGWAGEGACWPPSTHPSIPLLQDHRNSTRPPSVTSGEDRVRVCSPHMFRGWERSPFSSPLGINSLNLSRLEPRLAFSERETQSRRTDGLDTRRDLDPCWGGCFVWGWGWHGGTRPPFLGRGHRSSPPSSPWLGSLFKSRNSEGGQSFFPRPLGTQFRPLGTWGP